MDKDLFYMQQAIELAKLGRFTTTPNPNVGCIIVKDDMIIGKGFHIKAGLPHAEVYALQMAGDKAKDATAYVTLEPCSHYGRTPPCVNALIESGIKRVVVAMQDPNPNVAGQGIKRLADSGIEVRVGVLAQQAEAINKGFLKRMRTGLPFVQLKMAVSLDGKIAMASGESKWITSNAARQDVQEFRAQASCILSTRKTVQVDNASLTVRYNELPDSIKKIYPLDEVRQPMRVIIDSQNKMNGKENVFSQPGETWLVRKQNLPILSSNTRLIVEPSGNHQVDLSELLAILAKKQINSVWVEAGAHLAGALIEQELVDELIIYYAPKLLGHNAQDMCVLPNLQKLSLAPLFQFESVTAIGDDLRIILRKGVF
jgi:diaminohydroxyphosphoribosylaminopyrimidine deaminase / 5-amino-6-(5-phosphoribosylamino)uracil reductase